MRRARHPAIRLVIRLVIGLAAAAASAVHADVLVRDVTGAEVRLPAPARRVVSLAPYLTENLFAIGAGGRIVGTVEYANHPEAAKRLPRVGAYENLDAEAVVALKPDLVVAWKSGNPPAVLARLRALGIPVWIDEPGRIEDVAGTLERLGALTGADRDARTAAEAYRRRLADLRARYSARPTVRTFYQVWDRPLMTVGGPQIISDVIRLCGGANVFAAQAALAPTGWTAGGAGSASPPWPATTYSSSPPTCCSDIRRACWTGRNACAGTWRRRGREGRPNPDGVPAGDHAIATARRD